MSTPSGEGGSISVPRFLERGAFFFNYDTRLDLFCRIHGYRKSRLQIKRAVGVRRSTRRRNERAGISEETLAPFILQLRFLFFNPSKDVFARLSRSPLESAFIIPNQTAPLVTQMYFSVLHVKMGLFYCASNELLFRFGPLGKST